MQTMAKLSNLTAFHWRRLGICGMDKLKMDGRPYEVLFPKIIIRNNS